MLMFGLIGFVCRSWAAACAALLAVATAQLILVLAADRFAENGGLPGMIRDWLLTAGILFLASALRQAFSRKMHD